MSVEATVRESDNWFIGEDKTLLFEVAGLSPTDDVRTWTLSYELFTRRTRASVFSKVAPAVVGTTATSIGVAVAAADTSSLAPGVYHHVLRRTDVGYAQVLAYGPVVLRDPALI